MIKNLICLLIGLAVFGFGVYIHFVELSLTYAIIALVALVIAITFRSHGYKIFFSIGGLILFVYLIRYIWMLIGPTIGSFLRLW